MNTVARSFREAGNMALVSRAMTSIAIGIVAGAALIAAAVVFVFRWEMMAREGDLFQLDRWSGRIHVCRVGTCWEYTGPVREWRMTQSEPLSENETFEAIFRGSISEVGTSWEDTGPVREWRMTQSEPPSENKTFEAIFRGSISERGEPGSGR